MNDPTNRPKGTKLDAVIEAIAESINVHQTAIFCGAGISRESGIPVVNELVPYILLTLCADLEEIPAILNTAGSPKTRRQTLRRVIAQKMEAPPSVIDRIVNRLPFEAFIEILADNSDIEKILDIYNVEAYNPEVEPNTNHMMLASLLASGKVSTIVTTNFDRLIEKALLKLGRIGGLDYDLIFHEEDFGHIDWELDRRRLIKIHGSIDDKKAMAATISSVANQELSKGRESVIRQIYSLGNHKDVLVLGYSCSDIFDLNPQIEALLGNLKNVFLVQHHVSPRIDDIRRKKSKNPFKAFRNSARVSLDTNNLVEALWKATLKEPYNYHAATKVPDWKAKVHAWIVECRETHSDGIRHIISGRIFDAISEAQAAMRRYRLALAYANTYGADELKGLALGNMGNSLQDLGNYQESIGSFTQALKISRKIGDPDGEGGALNGLGLAYAALGEYRKALRFYKRYLAITHRTGNKSGEGRTLDNMGQVFANLGEYRKALGFYEQHVDIAHRIGDVRGEADALNNMGNVYRNLAEYKKAMGYFGRARDLAHRMGNFQGEGRALNNMGSTFLHLGSYRRAIVQFNKHYLIARRIGDKLGEGKALGNKGLAHMYLEENAVAKELYEQHAKIARELGDKRGEAHALNNIGVTWNKLNEHRKAIEILESALSLARECSDAMIEGDSLGNLGLAYAGLGQIRQAIKYYEMALEIDRRTEDKQGEGSDLNNMGLALSKIGEYHKAIKAYEKVLEIGRLIGDVRSESSAISNMGLAYGELGEYRKAIRLFKRVMSIDRRIGNVEGTGNDLANIGLAFKLLGDREKAKEAFTQSRKIFVDLGKSDVVVRIDDMLN